MGKAKALEGAAAYVLAAWKGGELLRGLEKAKGTCGQLSGRDSSGEVIMAAPENNSQYARTLESAKLSESTAKRWQRIAPRLTTGGGGALPERALRVR